MKTDLYTKAILTVIAISLAGIAIQLSIKDAHAQAQSKLLFARSGALIVTVCDSVLKRDNTITCAEAEKLERR